MPKTISPTLSPEGEGSSAPSVLDFLYHDGRRVASFLAQFEGDGHLQQLTRTKAGSRSKKDQTQKEVKGTAGFASGGYKSTYDIGLDMSEGYARVFDPYWANARALLDYLSESDLIQRDMQSARIGQFALATGALIIGDMQMVKSIWSLPSVREGVTRSPGASGEPKSAEEVAKAQAAMELMPLLPHSGHMHILNEHVAVWASADEDSLVTPMSNLVLKHGAKVAGEWSMLGIVDAIPSKKSQTLSDAEQERAAINGKNYMGKIAITASEAVREALGRPLTSYGMTPLLVFREAG